MEDWKSLLDKAALICVFAHQGQRDKVGQPYFQHPMRVAMACENEKEKIVALLHDVIEDTEITKEYLQKEGFPEEIVEAILSVTKRCGETYVDFVARAAQNPIGRIVKLHDLEDNLNIFRLQELDEDMAKRFNKYLRTYRYLKQEIEDHKPIQTTKPKEEHAASTKQKESPKVMPEDEGITFVGRFYINTVGCNAEAKLLSNGKMIILKGSYLREEVTPTFERKEYRQQIIDRYCTLTSEGYLVNEDLPPMSPSGSSGLIQGRSSNGKRDWLDAEGKQLSNYL